jgi:hypothetical protein
MKQLGLRVVVKHFILIGILLVQTMTLPLRLLYKAVPNCVNSLILLDRALLFVKKKLTNVFIIII